LNIYIPNDISLPVTNKELFILVRPFFNEAAWTNEEHLLARWGISQSRFRYTHEINKADFILLPYSINAYLKTGNLQALKFYNQQCEKFNIQGFGYISGDWGIKFPEFENLNYFRMGGFRSQLSLHNQGFPFSLSDHHKRIYGTNEIQVRKKQVLPVVGFCGHATLSKSKRVKESLKFLWENIKRGLRNPMRKDWEPVFPSAYHRALLMRLLEKSSRVKTNFVYRQHYRAGAIEQAERERTSLEYYDNIRNSDYVVCVRGGGNFSVRLYETLMMGRIPVFVNTDCLLPFPDQIDWKNYVVWVEWRDRLRIDEIIINFHTKRSENDFAELQVRNRKFWQEELSVQGMLHSIQSLLN
jgi:hypothetical protein